jgi:Tfp pilus assembly pilus retraction ATPase PilT
LLRQSADIVLVDQLSDEKVASTAVRAALSGRLIVAGIEAKSALAALARLSDLGIDPYLVAASLSGVLAQRQVRTLCKSCRKKDGDKYRAAGCAECEGTGYSGTVDVHEFVPMTDEIRKLIAEKAPLHKIEERASAAGFQPMDAHARTLLEKGETDEREIENTFRRPVADAAGPRPLKIVVSEAAKSEAKAVKALRKEPSDMVAEEYEESVRKEREEMESLFHKQSYELEPGGLDTAA